MAQAAWSIKFAQHNLEQKIGLTAEERVWVMRNNQLPAVRTFWSSYKRALNFINDTDKVNTVKTNLKFLRGIIRSGFYLEDPRFKILD
jgi:hypothetical protein